MPMERVRVGAPISRYEFHIRLREWLDKTTELSIGGSDVGVQAWIVIRDREHKFQLNADTKREGVEKYLGLVNKYGDDLDWTPTVGRGGSKNAIAFGPDQIRPRYFYFYRRK